MWRNTSRLLLWIHMHVRSKRFVLPAGDGGKRQQGTPNMGSPARGRAPLVRMFPLRLQAEQLLLQVLGRVTGNNEKREKTNHVEGRSQKRRRAKPHFQTLQNRQPEKWGFQQVFYFVGVPNHARLNLAVRLRAFLLRFS